MNIDSICMLIPIHPPHYDYLYALLMKLKENNIDIDIFLVFSSNAQYNEFTMKEHIHPIIIQEPIDTRCIVTFKKYYGLNKLITSKYDYILCCDSEIDILPEHFTKDNITKKIEQIFLNKKIYAGLTADNIAYNITKSCVEIFPKEIERLRNLTEDYRLYFWFSDLPVYRRSDLSAFFNTIQYNEIINHLIWNHFDYIIYQLYLILSDGFELINTTPITNMKWSLECMHTTDQTILDRLVDIGYGFSWNIKPFYVKNQDFIHKQKGFILYHIQLIDVPRH